MPNIDEYKKKGGWYEFPNGHKEHGADAAQEYLDNVDAAELFEEEEEDGDEYITEANTPQEPEEVEEESTEKEFLVRMTRNNVKYGINGDSGKRYNFTRAHPLVVVKESDVNSIVSQDGFELATPEQAKEFYS